jgi:hypothetical protein
MWTLISVRLETVLVSVQDRCTVCAKHTTATKFFLNAPDGTKRKRLKWMLISVCLKIVLFLTQDRCTICTEPTTGSKIALDTPDRTPR